MRGFVILTNRKRALIALVHTVLFLVVAVLLSRNLVRPLGLSSPVGSWALAGIYLTVTVVLSILLKIAGRAERLYFALCTASAS
jgi:hypothetical protein